MGVLVGAPEVCHRGQQFLGVAHVADEVGVGEADVDSADGAHGFDLRDDVVHALGARHPPVGDDDVAELALEGTAPGGLQEVVEVVVPGGQVHPRHRRQRDVDVALLLVEGLVAAGPEVVAELRPGDLHLAVEDHVELPVGEALGAQGGVRAAHHHHLPLLSEPFRDLPGAVVLDVPARDGHHVGVGLVLQRPDVLVLKLHVEVRRRQRGHGEKPQRSLRATLREDVGDPGQAPQGVREARVDEQNLHGVKLLIESVCPDRALRLCGFVFVPAMVY